MRARPQSIMLFAAGFGTRMKHLTKSRPKPLVSVAGLPLIDHALNIVADAKVANVIVNLHYRGDQIINHLQGRDITFSKEAPDILETGGGIKNALPLLGKNPVFTLNTDAVWRGENPLSILASAWDPARMDALLLCIPKSNAIGHKGKGDFIATHGPAERGPGDVYTGVQIIKTEFVAAVQDDVFSLNLVWDQMIKMGRLYTTQYDGQWCDVGQPESIALAENMLGFRS